MDILKVAAIALIVVGVLGLGYGGFTYTSQTHTADIGPIHMALDEKQRINVPIWAGIGAVVIGAYLLVGRRRRS